jgi:hypothetical protein
LTVKIRMLVDMSGTRNGQKWPPRGEITELPTAEAAHLVASGIAEKADDEDTVESAAAPPAEVTTPPEAQTPSRRRGRSGRGESTKE